jgi:3-oxoadipate enol-lactonase
MSTIFINPINGSMIPEMKTISDPEQKTLVKPDYTIYYYVSGKEHAEAMVFIHPAFADHRSWNTQIDQFSKDYCVITLDMLGHGQSQFEKTSDTIDMTVDHINEILSIEGYDSAHIVGASLGSLIGQYFAYQYPEKTKSVTVLGGYYIHEIDKTLMRQQLIEQLKWTVMIVFAFNYFKTVYVPNQSVITADAKQDFSEMASLFQRQSFQAMSGSSNILQNRDRETIGFPLLLLYGEHDREIVQDLTQTWHQTDPQSQLKIIPHAGHVANMDNPTEFNTILFQFLQTT